VSGSASPLDGLDQDPAIVDPAIVDPAELKACCARLYENDLVRALLGDSYHPGGLELTRRLARLAGVTAATEVLDVASGPGTTALALARELGSTVVGVDLGPATVDQATARAAEAGLEPKVTFRVGDAEALPVPHAKFDVVLCECALCTFPDKATAAAEMARVLRPGGRVAISDVVLDLDAVGSRLQSLAGWVACLADAKPLDTYERILGDAGLETVTAERHDDAVAVMIDTIEARLQGLRMVGALPPQVAAVDTQGFLDEARLALEQGHLGYCLLVAVKPAA
jgi:SAM-dependent methyltransferase